MNTKYQKYLPLEVRQSRWATDTEIQSSAVRIELSKEYPASGLPVFSDGKTMFVDAADTHSLIYGSSGSKKTRLFVFPLVNSLLQAKESCIITDPKGEIYDRTAGLAQKTGHKVVVLNFRDLSVSDGWNPLAEPFHLYKNPETRDLGISLLNDFIETLANKGRGSRIDPFWASTASSLALALLLILFESSSTIDEVNITNFMNLCYTFGSDEDEKYLKYLLNHIPAQSLCAINLRNILNAADKTKQSIQVSLFSYVGNYLINQTLQQMISVSDFSFADLAKQPFALYLILPDETTKYNDLVATLVSQSYQIFIREAQATANKRLPIRINYVLDEFNNIPRLPDADGMLSAARSRNIRFYLVVQGYMNQYGNDADIIRSNCTNWVFLTSRDVKLLTELSDLCGDGNDGNPLISTSQLQRLDKDKGEALLLFGRNYPYVGRFPDIDEYNFPRLEAPAFEKKNRQKIKYKTIIDILDQHKEKLSTWFTI